MPSIYFASKSRLWPFWAALRAAGLRVCSIWIDWKFNLDTNNEPSADHWREHADRCIRQAADAEILLLYACGDEERHFGSLLECGSALAGGAMVYLVSPHDWPFLRHHPNVLSFDTLEQAIAAIVALNAGGRDAQ
jgi:hypothetical protein